MRRSAGWSSLGAVLLVVGCGSGGDPAESSPSTGAAPGTSTMAGSSGGSVPTPTPPAPTTAPAATLSEAQVLGAAVAMSEGVIEPSELAATAAMGAVQAYAMRMVKDHMAAIARLQRLSENMFITPAESELSRTVEQEMENTENQLLARTGMDFDDAYVDSQVQMNSAALRRLDEQLIPSSASAELRVELASWRAAALQNLADAQALPRAGRGSHP
jgi:predicted outer membrane protein